MRTITATELARNLRRVLDRLAIEGEEIVIERNREQVARLLPGPGRQTALQAMPTSTEPSRKTPRPPGRQTAAGGGGREAGWIKVHVTHGILSGYLRVG